jgi:hypothetical protein
MGIQKDAGELMVFAHQRYIEDDTRPVESEELIKETGWDIQRLRRAVTYLADMGLIELDLTFTGFAVLKPYPPGIDIVENQNKFKSTFGFTVNLALVSFSWTVEKKS